MANGVNFSLNNKGDFRIYFYVSSTVAIFEIGFVSSEIEEPVLKGYHTSLPNPCIKTLGYFNMTWRLHFGNFAFRVYKKMTRDFLFIIGLKKLKIRLAK
jgi:hypothetical protein